MKSYVAVDESRLPGHRKLRRVLSSYLKRLGRRTWHGRLSREGLGELEAELKKAATRSARACVYDAETGETAISVGTGKRMDDEHGYTKRERREKTG